MLKNSVKLLVHSKNLISFAKTYKVSAVLNTDSSLWKSLFVRKLEPVKESQSDLLSKAEHVFELQTHSVRPECMADYLGSVEEFSKELKSKGTGAELVGSWTCEIGYQDEAIHLWRFSGGYPMLSKFYQVYRNEPEFVEFRRKRNTMLRSRRNQICLGFSFWPDLAPRAGSNIYELRSYTLKPGTMLEWGNHWAQGIKFRRASNEPVAGLFSHIGEMHQVHHFWAYKDLEHRKLTRDNNWRQPGWDDCVINTVPLIDHMVARILIPTPFSTLQ